MNGRFVTDRGAWFTVHARTDAERADLLPDELHRVVTQHGEYITTVIPTGKDTSAPWRDDSKQRAVFTITHAEYGHIPPNTTVLLPDRVEKIRGTLYAPREAMA